MDNECSMNMKQLIRETCRLELVQPYCHRRNVAEVAIKISKHTSYPSLPASTTTSPFGNGTSCSRRQSSHSICCGKQTPIQNCQPTRTYLAFGNFDYNRLPLAPLGCAVQVHDPPERQTSWGFRARKGWYIGCAWDHYRLHSYVDDGTSRSKVTGALEFKHKSRTNPTMTAYDKNMRAIQTLKA